MAELAAQTEATEQRLLTFTRGFPKPPAGKGVRADALLVSLNKLRPLAEKIAGMKVGDTKGSYKGAGYLTGKTVTTDDLAQAGRLLYEVDTRLPSYGQKPVEPWLLEQIKGVSQRVLLIGTDLDIDASAMDAFSRAWDSLGEAFDELPETLGKAAGAALHGAGQAAGAFGSGLASGAGLLGIVVLAGVALLVLKR